MAGWPSRAFDLMPLLTELGVVWLGHVSTKIPPLTGLLLRLRAASRSVPALCTVRVIPNAFEKRRGDGMFKNSRALALTWSLFEHYDRQGNESGNP